MKDIYQIAGTNIRKRILQPLISAVMMFALFVNHIFCICDNSIVFLLKSTIFDNQYINCDNGFILAYIVQKLFLQSYTRF